MKHAVFHHPKNPQMQVEVILASRNAAMPTEKPLVTMRLRYPRILHGEIMTHRVFSRNARSSRAVPVKTMLLETTSIPFVPWHWNRNQRGMQGGEPFTPAEIVVLEREWLKARDAAVDATNFMMDMDVHKQNPNRLLEPFSWIDVLITSNDWNNFLWLRDHEAAEPHLQDLARLVEQALDNMTVQDLEPGLWHLPYVTDEDEEEAIRLFKVQDQATADIANEWLRKISAARCARISYKPFDGDASYDRELERYNTLVSSDRVHASPTEHQATPDTQSYVEHLFYEKEGDEKEFNHDCQWEWDNPKLHGNLPGWVQARKLIPGEYHA